ncbi:MAG: hypothetical protein ABF391_08055 [Akkermansiaceae bacterium]
MNARIHKLDMPDVEADVLIYSTNVILICSGGVGARLVDRYGGHVQKGLHQLLDDQKLKHAGRGLIFQHVSAGMPCKKVFHTLPCDGFYETSPEIIVDLPHRCLTECAASPGINKVA